MHVLVLTVVHTPLDARIHARQARALLDAGHHVTLAAPLAGYGLATSDLDPRLEVVGLPRAQGRRRLAALRASRRLLARTNPDVTLLHDPELLLALPVRRSRTPAIWDVHEDLAASMTDKPWLPPLFVPLLRRASRWVERWGERRCAELLLAEDKYAPRFGAPHPVVPNLPLLPPSWRGPEDDRVVYLGRVSRLRGAGELAAAGRELAALGIALEVIGPVDEDVRDDLTLAEREGALQLLGFLPNVDALQRLDGALAGLSLLHDHPNYRHSLPTKVVEYQAAGVPVVTTPLPAAVAEVQAAGSGVVVPFADADAVVDAVRGLHQDRERARAMATAGRHAAAGGRSWDAVAPQFVRVVERVADAGARGSRQAVGQRDHGGR